MRQSVALFLALAFLSWAALRISAQMSVNNGQAVAGVAISTDGVLSVRQITSSILPPPAPTKTSTAAKEGMVYISLPRAFAQWKAAKETKQEVSADVRYLKGLTQIRNVFVFPAEHDLVIAGPSEPMRIDNPLEPLGTTTGRPVVQLEDLIAAIRSVNTRGGRDFFGCSLDPPIANSDAWNDTLKKFANVPRTRLLDELHKALGPQEVKLFGVPEDSRVALVMVAADYRLKRLSMGLDSLPMGIGTAMGTEPALARLWFEPAYEPLLMSADASSYEFRGPRLKVLAGAQLFQPGGAGPAQTRFATNFSNKMPEVATRVDAVADLQNIADCFMLAALLRQDQLPEKTGIDLAWLYDSEKYPIASLPVAKTAETLIHVSGNTIAQGGVAMRFRSFASVDRSKDKPLFATQRQRPLDNWFLAVTAKAK